MGLAVPASVVVSRRHRPYTEGDIAGRGIDGVASSRDTRDAIVSELLRRSISLLGEGERRARSSFSRAGSPLGLDDVAVERGAENAEGLKKEVNCCNGFGLVDSGVT